MIDIKELYNRIYQEKDCTGFDYSCIDQDDTNKQKLFEARFRRSQEDDKTWTMYVVLLKSKVRDSQVYSVSYQLPKSGMNLNLICAIGLKYFQLQLKEELQEKALMDLAIGDAVKEM